MASITLKDDTPMAYNVNKIHKIKFDHMKTQKVGKLERAIDENKKTSTQ